MQFAGIDIGGANIKLATVRGDITEIAFPIWKDKEGLHLILQDLAAALPQPCCLGVTMTAELADCFVHKQEGVNFIVNAVTKSFPDHEPRFYRTDGDLCESDVAIAEWRFVAASNWHALAWLAFQNSKDESGFVFDIGSTTSDIIPVKDRLPVQPGQNDLQRLQNSQLFYAGIGRTPVCSLLSKVHFDFGRSTVARELFATVEDVLLWLGQVNPNEAALETADGQPANKLHAGHRLARMVCADFRDLNARDIDAIALQTKQALVNELSCCLENVLSKHSSLPFVFKTFGGGSWLAEEVIHATLNQQQIQNVTITPFSYDKTVNQTAAALAVAKKREQAYLQTRIVSNA